MKSKVERLAADWLAALEAYEAVDAQADALVHNGEEGSLDKIQRLRTLHAESMRLLTARQHVQALLRAAIKESVEAEQGDNHVA